jgi:XRE family aerobic/anaerobic benzoate catabolism transcriptional regulator
MQRVIAQGDMRPMAENRESMADLRKILSVREPLYSEADVAVDTSGRSLGESFDALLKAVQVTTSER